MSLLARIFFIAVAIPAIFYIHILVIFFAVGFTSDNRSLEWPIIGLGLLSFVTTVTFTIALVFRDQKQ